MDTIRNKIYLLHHELSEALFKQNSAETSVDDATTGEDKIIGPHVRI